MDEEIKEEAKLRFMTRDYKSIPKLAEDLNIPLDTLKNWAYKNEDAWLPERNKFEQSAVEQAAKSSAKELALVWEESSLGLLNLLDVMRRGIEDGSYSPRDHSKLATTYINIMKAAHPMLRLEEGGSHSIKENEEEDSSLDIKDPFESGEENDV